VRPETRQLALLRARTEGFEHKLAVARREVRRALEIGGVWAVSFSGGKDSTALLGLVHERAPRAPVVWSDEGLELPQTLEFVERTRARVAEFHHQASSQWWPLYPAEDRAPELVGKAALREREGWAGYFIGLRADESRRRRLHLRTHGVLCQVRGGEWHCCPLAWWSALDVWAYILSEGLDYNRAYDRLDDLGVPLERQRLGPMLDERAVDGGSLEALRAGWPELAGKWSRLEGRRAEGL